jgi:hypothetical protein
MMDFIAHQTGERERDWGREGRRGDERRKSGVRVPPRQRRWRQHPGSESEGRWVGALQETPKFS